MMVLRRTALPIVNAIMITLALFAMMYSLIYMDDPELATRPSFPKIVFNHVPEDTPVVPVVAKVERPEEVEPLPNVPIVDEHFEVVDYDTEGWATYQPQKIEGDSLLPLDNQLVIALGFPPEYPRGPLQRGVEGYAVVGFSVNAAGAVYDQFIIESEPGTTFDRASLKAISKFKYKARKVNGRAVSTDGQRYMFTFKIDQ